MILLFQYQYNRELFDFVGITTKVNNSSVLTQRKLRRRDAEVFTLRKSVRPTFSICYNCFSSLQRAWSGVTTFASSLLPLCAFYDFPMAAFTPADSANAICILSAICFCPICFTTSHLHSVPLMVKLYHTARSSNAICRQTSSVSLRNSSRMRSASSSSPCMTAYSSKASSRLITSIVLSLCGIAIMLLSSFRSC